MSAPRTTKGEYFAILAGCGVLLWMAHTLYMLRHK